MQIYTAIIIGSGFGGMTAALKLKRLGIDGFLILERRHFAGGTWCQNTYPGAAVDVPSTLYAKIPDFPGRDTFKGKAFHTNVWDHSYDLRNKRVAVIGSGASAAQVIPAIVMPRHDKTYSSFERWLMGFPSIYKFVRASVRCRTRPCASNSRRISTSVASASSCPTPFTRL